MIVHYRKRSAKLRAVEQLLASTGFADPERVNLPHPMTPRELASVDDVTKLLAAARVLDELELVARKMLEQRGPSMLLDAPELSPLRPMLAAQVCRSLALLRVRDLGWRDGR